MTAVRALVPPPAYFSGLPLEAMQQSNNAISPLRLQSHHLTHQTYLQAARWFSKYSFRRGGACHTLWTRSTYRAVVTMYTTCLDAQLL